MAQLQNAFIPTNYDPANSGGASLPLGKHPAVIKTSQLSATKAGDSGMLVLHVEIVDGPATGATGMYRLNLYNQNPQAREIAERQLSSLCCVIGHFGELSNTEQLHNRPFVIEVVAQKGEEAQKKGYTEIARVYTMSGEEPSRAMFAQGQASATASFDQASQSGQSASAWGGGGQAAQAQPQVNGSQVNGSQAAWAQGGQGAQAATKAPWG